jgi:deazaflavin-dependent oxidoreductase (nitroreductase family)
MPSINRSKGITLFWRLHRWLFQISDGRIGSSLFGVKILKVTTKGRRTEEPRAILIYYYPYQDSFVIVGSNLGADWHPAWYLNLQSDPAAEIQRGRERRQVVARTATGRERESLWAEIVKKDESYKEYQALTSREFPLVILDPVDKQVD